MKGIIHPNLIATPFIVSIPTGQWSGASEDYYITVTASNVTANSILVPTYDHTSDSQLKGPVWCVPAAGSFTIHTSAIPTGTVTIMVQFVGTLGEAQYQVLADVYSKNQTDAIVAQSTATGGTNYFQSPDGTQICYLYIRDFTFQPNTTTTKEYTFPKPFLESPAISMSVRTTIPNQLIASPYNTSGTGFTLEGVSTFSVAQNPWVAVIAIGRWK